DGTLEAITHDAITVTSQYEDFFRQETGWAGLLYKSTNAKYVHKFARLDLSTSCDMRCPSAPTGRYALECAMDEPSVGPKVDPLELRLRCYSERDQNDDRPFSSKALRECYRQPRRLGGTGAILSHGRCGTPATWSAGAWRPASGTRCSGRSLCVSC